MSDNDLKDLYRRYIEALNAHEFDRMDEFAHEDVSQQFYPASRDELIRNLKAITDAVPDFHWVVKDIAVSGNNLGVRLLDTGTPVKEWLGAPLKNKRFEIEEYAVYEVRDGKFIHMAALFDAATLKKQLEG